MKKRILCKLGICDWVYSNFIVPCDSHNPHGIGTYHLRTCLGCGKRQHNFPTYRYEINHSYKRVEDKWTTEGYEKTISSSDLIKLIEDEKKINLDILNSKEYANDIKTKHWRKGLNNGYDKSIEIIRGVK